MSIAVRRVNKLVFRAASFARVSFGDWASSTARAIVAKPTAERRNVIEAPRRVRRTFPEKRAVDGKDAFVEIYCRS
jgi:hypothetical protein